MSLNISRQATVYSNNINSKTNMYWTSPCSAHDTRNFTYGFIGAILKESLILSSLIIYFKVDKVLNILTTKKKL